MDVSISEKRTKELIAEVMVDMLRDKKGELYAVILDAIEEIAFANAIAEGRKDEFVGEVQIMEILASSNPVKGGETPLHPFFGTPSTQMKHTQ